MQTSLILFNVTRNNMSGTSLALKIGSLILGLGVYLILFKKVKGLKKYALPGLLYIISVSIILSLSTLIALLNTTTNEIKLLVVSQLFVISVGILHVVVASKTLPWYREQFFATKIGFLFLFCFLPIFLPISLSHFLFPLQRSLCGIFHYCGLRCLFC